MTTATTKTTSRKRSNKSLAGQTLDLALDFGNYAVKSQLSGFEPLIIRSVLADIHQGTQPKSHKDDSPIVMYEGQRFHFGRQAFKYRNFESVVMNDKTQDSLIIRAMLASLQPSGTGQGDSNAVAIYRVNLKLGFPASYGNTEGLSDVFCGRYQFTRNGQDLIVDVEGVTPIQEGVAAYRYAQSLGMVSDHGYTLMIDIGGGTWNGLLLDEDGDLVDTISYDKSGGIQLATEIAENRNYQMQVGDQLDLAVVMDAIADGSHTYLETGVSWGDEFDSLLRAWFKRNMLKTLGTLKPHLPRIHSCLFTGGNAHLLGDVVSTIKGSFPAAAILPEPTLANVRGMLV